MDLPDERAFALTPEQLAAALPRRGGRAARPFAIREGQTEWWRHIGVDERRDPLDAAADEPTGDPEITAALRAYLDGAPDPLGAAAAFLVDVAVGTPFWRDREYSQYDAWLGEHGAVFAAAALLEYYTLRIETRIHSGAGDWRARAEGPLAVTRAPDDPPTAPYRNLVTELQRLRVHLATLPETEYRAVEAALEPQGRDRVQRRARAYAAPSRTDWVDLTCAEQPGWRFAGYDRMLLQSVSSMDQIAASGITRLSAREVDAGVVFTLLDGVGPDCAPLLAAADDLAGLDPDQRDLLAGVLGAIPDDATVRYFTGGIAERRTWDALQTVADRFPVRTLRVIAADAPDLDRDDLTRLTGLIESKPLLRGPARDALDDADRDRIDALLERRGLPPETADVPAALTEPPKTRKTAPAWSAMCAASPVLLKGRKARLPQAAVANLIAALALDTPKSPHPAVDAAIAHCDAASLRDLSWAVFTAWDLAADRGNPWAFAQLARFADDDGVRRLEALIHEWPGQSLHKRAVRGLELLGAVGTEEALAAVHRISRTSGYKGLKKAALAEVDRIAARLGLDEEQLLDRLVPDFELDADGRMALDFGPRAFTVGFDEQLKPFVIDPKGKVRKSLPKPGADDDPEAAADAAARFDRLKRSLKSVGTEQVKRLERAMTAGRVWARADFERYFARHALMRHLARRVVWQYTEGREWTSFRVAEDGTFADVHDNGRRLPERSAVRLPHPLLLAAETAAWAEVFADYELVQPFEQLARPVVALTPEEAATGRLARFEGRSVPVGPLIGLWRSRTLWSYSDAFSDPGEPLGLKRELPGDGFLLLGLAPGIDPAAPGAEPHQTLKAVRLSMGESADDPAPRGLDPVAASELLALLERLAVR
ncbi:DUF4132 domain-containing protein [Glycomyces artemisiae]|uniref:Uncharacterized protein DUF4132 n=1 Tax=Glycomyces artemisiae TaxID=1076443 RepID=A0A2T0UKQ4_9ACTN|nr:DUF4132 domain-containing protein [Glycomyces artemisiae]PRY58502.1 uncharacterized protein DUF4132 [Glycomyces artemisiae]